MNSVMPLKAGRSLLTFGVIAIIWKAASLTTNPLIFPPPETVVKSLVGLLSAVETWKLMAGTAKKAITGLIAAIMAGVGCGIIMMPITPYIRPAVASLQNIPLVTWVLLAIIWFGFTDTSVSFVVFVATLPVIYLNTVAGASAIDPRLLEMAKNFRIPTALRRYGIELASVATHISAGVSVAIAIMWKSVVMAELFASSPGIGTAMEISRTYLQTDRLMAWTLLLVILGLFSEYLWRLVLQKRLFAGIYRAGLRWLPACSGVPGKVNGGIFKADQVMKCFRHNAEYVRVLNNVSLQLHPGDRTVLTGPSGSGKTTLLRILAGLDEPDGGLVTRSKKYACIMFQEPRLLPWFTAEENIILALRGRMPFKEARAKARNMLGRLGIPAHLYPEQLSGGMSKAVSLARTLAVKADVILLDEPFSSSDAGQKKRMVDLIKDSIGPENILVVVSHESENGDLQNSKVSIMDLQNRPEQVDTGDWKSGGIG